MTKLPWYLWFWWISSPADSILPMIHVPMYWEPVLWCVYVPCPCLRQKQRDWYLTSILSHTFLVELKMLWILLQLISTEQTYEITRLDRWERILTTSDGAAIHRHMCLHWGMCTHHDPAAGHPPSFLRERNKYDTRRLHFRLLESGSESLRPLFKKLPIFISTWIQCFFLYIYI